jgi:hypothetical protein
LVRFLAAPFRLRLLQDRDVRRSAGDARGRREIPFATDSRLWHAALKGAGTRGFRLHHVRQNHPKFADRMTVGFVGGGGRWLIEAAGDERADLWEAGRRIGDRNDPEQKIWEVTHARVARDRPLAASADEGLEAASQALAEVLPAIAAFADRQRLEFFAGCFRPGFAALRSETPLDSITRISSTVRR